LCTATEHFHPCVIFHSASAHLHSRSVTCESHLVDKLAPALKMTILAPPGTTPINVVSQVTCRCVCACCCLQRRCKVAPQPLTITCVTSR
jgi:hypothetical protein